MVARDALVMTSMHRRASDRSVTCRPRRQGLFTWRRHRMLSPTLFDDDWPRRRPRGRALPGVGGVGTAIMSAIIGTRTCRVEVGALVRLSRTALIPHLLSVARVAAKTGAAGPESFGSVLDFHGNGNVLTNPSWGTEGRRCP